MDLAAAAAPRSDQQNYDDYIAGPRVVTISAVKEGSKEQPVVIELAEYPGRPYKPNKSMIRVLLVAWGNDSREYVGRTMKLVGNPAVTFGGAAVGGIQIAELSHIDGTVSPMLTVSKGVKKRYTVKPLSAAPARDWLAELATIRNSEDKVEALGREAKAANAPTDALAQIRERYIELRTH